jgi:type IV pilus biogenesis protein PilP
LCGEPGRAQVPADPAEPPAARPSAPSDGADDRLYLLNRQRETFRLTVETDYAQALQRLCQTGFGDPALCQRRGPPSVAHDNVEAALPERTVAAMVRPVAAPAAWPVVEEIFGAGDQLTAILRLPDGRHWTVSMAGDRVSSPQLPSGDTVLAVEPRQVIIKRPGQPRLALPLASGDHAVQPTPSRGDAP